MKTRSITIYSLSQLRPASKHDIDFVFFIKMNPTTQTCFWLLLFPADCLHLSHCHRQIALTGSAGYSEFPAYGQILLRRRYSP